MSSNKRTQHRTGTKQEKLNGTKKWKCTCIETKRQTLVKQCEKTLIRADIAGIGIDIEMND